MFRLLNSSTFISGNNDKTIKIWDVNRNKEKMVFAGNTAQVSSVSNVVSGQYVISRNFDGVTRYWDFLHGSQLWAANYAPSNFSQIGMLTNTNIGFSSDGRSNINIWDRNTGKTIHVIKGHLGNVDKIASSHNELYLASMDSYGAIKLWDLNSKKEVRTIRKPVSPSGSGKLIFSANDDYLIACNYDGAIELFEVASGRKVNTLYGHKSYITSASVSKDGKYLVTGSGDKTLRLWDLATGNTVKIVGSHDDSVLSVAFYNDDHNVLSLGADKCLKFWNLDDGDTKTIKIKYNLTSYESLSLSSNNKHAFVGSLDGSLTMYDLQSGEEIAKFIGFTDKNWIVVTPEGFYNSSIYGHKYLNISRELKSYSIEQFYDVFYRPDIVQAKLNGEDIKPLINITINDAIQSPPPSVKFVKLPSDSPTFKSQICYQATSTGGGIGEVRIFHNGKLIKSDGFYRESIVKAITDKRQLVAMNSRAIQDEMRGLVVRGKDKPSFIETKPKGETFEECIDLETVPGENEISVTAFNAGNTIQSYMQTTSFNSNRHPDEPHLYILSVGIDKYSDASINLKYAAKDASDFIAKLPVKARSLYKLANIHLETILDTQASRAGILNKIDELSTKIKPGDSFILFVASHGVLVQDQYYIVTSDYNGNVNDSNKLISSNEIVDMSKKIKSLSQLFIFDTCHAGGVDNIISGLYDARMSVMAKKMGLHIYASAGSVQTAMDGYKGNGLYTHTLLQGIANGDDVDQEHSGKVTVKSLGLYTKDKTTEISTKLGHVGSHENAVNFSQLRASFSG